MIELSQPWTILQAPTFNDILVNQPFKLPAQSRVAYFLDQESDPRIWAFAILNTRNHWERIRIEHDTPENFLMFNDAQWVRMKKQLAIILERIRFLFFNSSPNFSGTSIRITSTNKTTESQ